MTQFLRSIGATMALRSVTILGLLSVAACGSSAAPITPTEAMKSFEDEVARIQSAKVDGFVCDDVQKTVNGDTTESHLYCKSDNGALGTNLLGLTAGDRRSVALFAKVNGAAPDATKARASLAGLLSIYGVSSADLDRCGSEGRFDLEQPTYHLICEGNLMNKGDIQITIKHVSS